MIYKIPTLSPQKQRRFYNPYLQSLATLGILFISSCGKKTSTLRGSNALVYESQFYSSINNNLEALSYTSTIEVSNAKPQEQMYGAVYNMGLYSTSNGNSLVISDVNISDVKASDIYLSSVYSIDSLENYIQSGKLILRYIDSGGNKIDQELASYASIDKSAKKVLFNETTNDLTSFCKNNPSIFLFEIKLKSKPVSDINLKYHVALEYSYSYDERESN